MTVLPSLMVAENETLAPLLLVSLRVRIDARSEFPNTLPSVLRTASLKVMVMVVLIATPVAPLAGSIKPHTKFECEVYVLSKEEGGRHTPFFNNYRPQFYFRTTDVTGAVTLPEGTEMVMPGDNVKMTVALIAPIAMEQGLRFAIREGGRTVGAGVVAKILD